MPLHSLEVIWHDTAGDIRRALTFFKTWQDLSVIQCSKGELTIARGGRHMVACAGEKPSSYRMGLLQRTLAQSIHLDREAFYSRLFQRSLPKILDGRRQLTLHALSADRTQTFEAHMFEMQNVTPSTHVREIGPRMPVKIRPLEAPLPEVFVSALARALAEPLGDYFPFALTLRASIKNGQVSLHSGLSAWARNGGATKEVPLDETTPDYVDRFGSAALIFFSNKRIMSLAEQQIVDACPDFEDHTYLIAAFRDGIAIMAEDLRYLTSKHGTEASLRVLAWAPGSHHQALAATGRLDEDTNALIRAQLPWVSHSLLRHREVALSFP